MASSNALTKRSLDTDLMPPPPPPKRIKRPPKVLDEDTYTNALSHIIARDFFPGLLESETQQEYLDALDAGDANWIEEAGHRVRAAMTPVRRGRRGVSMTPVRREGFDIETPKSWRGETPRSARGSATPSGFQRSEAREQGEKKDIVDLNMGLTAFQAKYTSEDNESFNKVLDKQNEKRAEKYRWMWNGNKLPSKQQIAQAAVQQKLLQAGQSEGGNLDGSTNTQTLIIPPRPSQDQDLRPAMISQLPSSGPRNTFMFDPPDLSETHPTYSSIAQTAQAASSAPPKSVAYTNTRLPTLSFPSDSTTPGESSIPESPSLSAIDAAIAGHIRHRPDSTIAPSGSETPRVNGYAFVDEEPTPSELGIRTSSSREDANNDLLTQLILSTSSSAEGGGGGGGGVNPFTIHASSARESLHHRMVEKTLASKRAASGIGRGRLAQIQQSAAARDGRTPTPKFASSPRITTKGGGTPVMDGSNSRRAAGGGGGIRAGMMTPAAQQLYSKLGKTPKTGEGVFSGPVGAKGGGSGSWTPTPLRVRRAA